MLNNNDFVALERRLWAEGNPLCDELVSTRDELIFLLSQAKKVLEKYSPMLNKEAGDDLDYMRDWDNFGDTLDNIAYELGECLTADKPSYSLGPNPLDNFPSIWGTPK